MAKVKAKARKKARTIAREIPFARRNYLLFGAGVLLLIVGYFALAQGPYDSFSSLTLAPILLVIGYCVVLPFAIMYRGGKETSRDAGTNRGD